MKIKKEITEKLDRSCACCGGSIKVVLYCDGSYRGGHYFGEVPVNRKEVEYWECPKCYWR